LEDSYLLHFFSAINSIGRILNEQSAETLAHCDGRGQGESGLDFARAAPDLTQGKKSVVPPADDRRSILRFNF
jgi:hypothetical protein